VGRLLWRVAGLDGDAIEFEVRLENRKNGYIVVFHTLSFIYVQGCCKHYSDQGHDF